jgi:hypothetical protein
VIDVFATSPMERIGSVTSEKGAHTTALSPAGDRLRVPARDASRRDLSDRLMFTEQRRET